MSSIPASLAPAAPFDIGTARGVVPVDPVAATPATAQPAPALTLSATSAGTAPVDAERVSTIKRAIDTGNYPLVPARIGDAMIAAGLMLRKA